jgi:hypothetical protein
VRVCRRLQHCLNCMKHMLFMSLSAPSGKRIVSADLMANSKRLAGIGSWHQGYRAANLLKFCYRAVEFYDHLRDYEGMLEVSPDGEQPQQQ